MNNASAYQVAQFNWGILKADWDDPVVADFVDNLDRVNSVAHRSRGFVWQMPSDQMEAAQNSPGGILGSNPRLASTLSIWNTAEDLEAFVHQTIHNAFLKRRDEWYEKGTQKLKGNAFPRYVIWPVIAGHRPDLAEAVDKLKRLDAFGSSEDVYDFRYLSAQRSVTEATA
ncbi:MAG: DUF3291 domain-containing protein [Pseudoruegeria sp.]